MRITKWDAAEFLTTPTRVAAYLEAAFEDGDPEMVKVALGNIARAKGMTQIAKTTGARRSSLYRSLSREGNPGLTTLAGVLDTFGLRLSVTPKRVGRKRVDANKAAPTPYRVQKKRSGGSKPLKQGGKGKVTPIREAAALHKRPRKTVTK